MEFKTNSRTISSYNTCISPMNLPSIKDSILLHQSPLKNVFNNQLCNQRMSRKLRMISTNNINQNLNLTYDHPSNSCQTPHMYLLILTKIELTNQW